MSAATVLIPAKFITITLHLIVTSCIIANYRDNITSGGVSETNTTAWSSAKSSVLTAAWLTMIGLVIEIIILFIGININANRLNITQSMLHGIGVVLYAWFSLDNWKYSDIWTPWFFFSFCPIVIEIYTVFRTRFFYQKFKA